MQVAVPPWQSAVSVESSYSHACVCVPLPLEVQAPQVWPSLTVSFKVVLLPALSVATTVCSPSAGCTVNMNSAGASAASAMASSAVGSTTLPFTVTLSRFASVTVSTTAPQ